MIKRCVEAGLAEPEFALSDGFVTTIRSPAPVTGTKLGPSRHQLGARVRAKSGQVTPQDTPQVAPQVTPQVGARVSTKLAPVTAPVTAPV